MGGLRLFDVRLDNPGGVYYGGNVVTGMVVLQLSEEKKARGVRVELTGESSVHWTERRTTGTGDNRRTETRHYRSNETYVNQRVHVMGDGTQMQIAPGSYELPFQLQLPLNIPSSFIGEYGKIVYRIKAVVDRPWRFDHETHAFFTVDGLYDLNMDPSAASPLTMTNHKMLGILCCKSGPISATVQLDRSGYVPGEKIYLQAIADNQSTRLMNKTLVRLIQDTIFLANGRSKTCERKVFEYESGPIEPGESASWQDTALEIPPLPPSKLPNCNNIQIEYRIEFRVDPSGIGFDLVLKAPIVIGSIPLISTFNNFRRPSASPSITPSAPPSSKKPSAPQFSQYPELPPPTYEEATADDFPGLRTEDDNEHAEGNWDYRPQYPSYRH